MAFDKLENEQEKRNDSVIDNCYAAGTKGNKTVFLFRKTSQPRKIEKRKIRLKQREGGAKSGRKPISALFITTSYLPMVVTWVRCQMTA